MIRLPIRLFVLATLLGGTASAQFRSIDGSGTNPIHPDFGAAETPLLRGTSNGYADGLSAPGGVGRPSARAVSNACAAQSSSILNERRGSDWVWQWGQFLDHDMDLTEGASPVEPFDIPVPAGDPFFDPFNTGMEVIGLHRSLYTVDSAGVRQQINQITAWVDGSNVYGSDIARALELRTLSGGRLKTSAGNLLPFNVNGFPNAGGTSASLFLAGDVRANEQNGLTAVHTLFVREHNRWANLFAQNPFLSDDLVYQLARRMVWAEIQSITYNEFLPVLLGEGALSPYSGYDPSVDPGIDNVFSTATYRVGHTMLSATLLRLDSNFDEIPAGNLPLADAFFNPQEISDHGIEPLLRGLCGQKAQRVDNQIVDAVRNFLFGPPGAGGFDLGSLNIQRGRDHGLPDYNQARIELGLAPKTTFAEITSDPAAAAALEATYGDVNDIDVWVGALAEDHVPGAMVGELVRASLVDQFERLRDGDRYWYQNHFHPVVQHFIERQTLGRIIRRNTSIGNELPTNVFIAREVNAAAANQGSFTP